LQEEEVQYFEDAADPSLQAGVGDIKIFTGFSPEVCELVMFKYVINKCEKILKYFIAISLNYSIFAP
jgi:hypothetical protein